MMLQDSLEPAAIQFSLRSNAYRSLPGHQDIFSLLFHAFISTGTLESDLISYYLEVLLAEPNGTTLFYLFIKALQHKY